MIYYKREKMIKDEILNFIQGGKEPPKPMRIVTNKEEKARLEEENKWFSVMKGGSTKNIEKIEKQIKKVAEKDRRELEKLREEWRKESDRMSYSKEREHER